MLPPSSAWQHVPPKHKKTATTHHGENQNLKTILGSEQSLFNFKFEKLPSAEDTAHIYMKILNTMKTNFQIFQRI